METETLSVAGYTPFAMVPRWVIRHPDLSATAKALYADLMTYAANDTHAAFPGRAALADDLGVSLRTIGAKIRELEARGIIRVTSRRNKHTGAFYSNHYELAYESPWAKNDTRPRAKNDTLTRPTTRTRPTDTSCAVTSDDAHALHNQIGTDKATASALVDLIEAVHAHSEPVSETSWETWNRVSQALDHATDIDSADAIFNRRWDERLWELVAQSPGTRYGCARWIAQVVAYERSQWAA